MPSDLPPRAPDPSTGPPPSSRAGQHLRGIQGVMLGITFLALVAIVVLPSAYPRKAPPALRVLLAQPTLEHGGALEPQRAALLLEAARDALERQTAGRATLMPLDSAGGASPVDAARAQRADEALVLALRCSRNERPAAERRVPCRGELQRVRTVDGIARWRQPLRFTGDDLRSLDDELRDAVQVAYLRYPMRAEPPPLRVEADDYIAYLEVRRRRAEGVPTAGLLQRIETLLETSPRFADAQWLRGLLLVDSGRRDEAIAAFQNATRIAPTDPRPLEHLIELYEAAGRPVDADEARHALRLIERRSEESPRDEARREAIRSEENQASDTQLEDTQIRATAR